MGPHNFSVDPSINYRECFVPQIKEKQFQKVPLDPRILDAQRNPPKTNHKFENVYIPEIQDWLKQKISALKTTTGAIHIEPVKRLEDTELVYITTRIQLDTMISDIEEAGEVAIDLEHNDFHSYRGITCLVQLSTRTKDYLVDPFEVFKHLHLLNRITTNPSIIKVFHAGDLDILWLQRDFGVFIVNMFDTSQAAQVAGIDGGHGLANLLKVFCNVPTNKEYQMADWTIRPLSEGMLRYARMDTHFLLYIADRLKETILLRGSPGNPTVWGRNMLITVYEKSTGVCMKTYEDTPPDFEPNALKKFLSKFQASKLGDIKTNPKSKAALIGALKWRDSVARRMDKSKHYVLSNSDCLKIANGAPSSPNAILRLVGRYQGGSFASMKITQAAAEDLLRCITIEIEAII